MQFINMLMGLLALLVTAATSTPVGLDTATATVQRSTLDNSDLCKQRNPSIYEAISNGCNFPPGDFVDGDEILLPQGVIEGLEGWSNGDTLEVSPWGVLVMCDKCASQGTYNEKYGATGDTLTTQQCLDQFHWICANGLDYGAGARQYGSDGCQMWYIPQIADDGGIDFNISHYEYVWDVNGVRQ